jgi:tight adherence protein B
MVSLAGSTLAVAVLVFLAVAFAMLGVATTVEGVLEGKRRKKIVSYLQHLDTELVRGDPAMESVLRKTELENAAWVQQVVAYVPRLDRVERAIRRAALHWSLEGFLIRSGGFAVGLGVGGLVVFGLSPAPFILAGVGASLPYLQVKRRAHQRLARFEEQLPDAIDLMGRALRAGHPLTAGLRMVAEEAPNPVAGEFRLMAEEQRFGMPFEDTLAGLAERVPLVDVRILITAITIQREVGGNLAEILDNLARIIRQRFTIRRQLRVITAEGRMSMWVLMGLPIGVGGLIFMVNPEYMMPLFRDPMGRLMIYSALVMQGLGFLWVRKIVDLKI